MSYKLILHVNLQLARVLGLVRTLEAVRLERAGRPSWGVLVRGRFFERLIRDEILMGPTLIRPLSAYTPRPRAFDNPGQAQRFIASLGPTPVGWLRSRLSAEH